MKITWLGQAGLLFEIKGKLILIDPYLSDSVSKDNPKNQRRVPVDTQFLKLEPDMIICTHDHKDHLDPETMAYYLQQQKAISFLCPQKAWEHIRELGRDMDHNYILFDRHTEWTEFGIRFRAVKAQHSDVSAIGVLIEAEEKCLYVTGDTLYHREIFGDLPEKIDAIFLPVNGVGNNMNFTDAARFAARINAKNVVPIHWGLFDSLDVEQFSCENRVIPQIYHEIELK